MDATDTQRRLRALKGSGAWMQIAALAGVSYFTIQRFAGDRGKPIRPSIVARLARAIEQYERRQDALGAQISNAVVHEYD